MCIFDVSTSKFGIKIKFEIKLDLKELLTVSLTEDGWTESRLYIAHTPK